MLSFMRSRSFLLFFLFVLLLLLLTMLILTTTALVLVVTLFISTRSFLRMLSPFFLATASLLLVLMLFLLFFVRTLLLNSFFFSILSALPALFFLLLLKGFFNRLRLNRLTRLSSNCLLRIFFSNLFKLLLNNLQSNFESFNFSPQSQKSLMNFSLKMHLNSLFGIIDSLNGTTDITNLYDENYTFWCFITARMLSPIKSTSFRCSLSLYTSSRHREESSIWPFSPKMAACLIISSISLSIAKILSSNCLGR